MSGFFILRRELFGSVVHRLSGQGFKIVWAAIISRARDGDRINAVLAAGYNFALLLRWLVRLLCASSRRSPQHHEASLGLKTALTRS
jgi:hypothetical protein